ncbi:hypothetical protein VTI74DRAFT_8529 [Chaetomium olivicolor]
MQWWFGAHDTPLELEDKHSQYGCGKHLRCTYRVLNCTFVIEYSLPFRHFPAACCLISVRVSSRSLWGWPTSSRSWGCFGGHGSCMLSPCFRLPQPIKRAGRQADGLIWIHLTPSWGLLVAQPSTKAETRGTTALCLAFLGAHKGPQSLYSTPDRETAATDNQCSS